MRLTKIIALQFCEDIWNWLAVNPGKDKSDYPDWEVDGGSMPEAPYDCPCCGYAVSFSGGTKDGVEDTGISREQCKHCPLASFWPGGRCLDQYSPYMLWDKTNPKSKFGPLIRMSCAMMIAGAARQEWQRLESKAKSRKDNRVMREVQSTVSGIQKARRRER